MFILSPLRVTAFLHSLGHERQFDNREIGSLNAMG
jgi:hypothetical protein